jgi:hypothetical protein
MNPPPDARVHDRVVLDEIELYGDLIIAASDSEGPLSEEEIDAILGVRTAGDALADAVAAGRPGACAPRAGDAAARRRSSA